MSLADGVERAAFWLTVILAGATFWISPRPPMEDLAQHAGQVVLWRDLLLGTSKWQPLLQVNYFTPYLLGSGLALLLSFVMPVGAALKLLLTLSYCGFVAACILLRRWMGGDRRLDWLFVTGFFGLAYAYGFFPFLIALPIAVLFTALAHRHAGRPTPAWGALLCMTGLALFFAHGLAFLFANAIGVTFLLLRRQSLRLLSIGALPYAALGLLCLVYFFSSPPGDPASPQWLGLFGGLNNLLFFPFGSPGVDWLYTLLVPLLLCAPLVLGCRINWRNKAAFVPISVLLLWLALVPESWADNWFAASRFAVFFLPFYALMFSAPEPAGRRPWLMLTVAPALCLAFVAIHAGRSMAFSRESRSFDDVLAATEPGYRVRGVVLDAASAAAANPRAYASFPVWYQVEKQGLADPNFAYFPIQVVSFRDRRLATGDYRYYFVRHAGPLPAKVFPDGACNPVLRKSSGNWSVFENSNC